MSSVKFCPKCGSMLLPKKTEEALILECSTCGYTMRPDRLEKYGVIREPKKKEELQVIEEATKVLPTTHETCVKCGHDVACWWMQQTRGADEPPTRFYRCAKCGHVWRGYE